MQEGKKDKDEEKGQKHQEKKLLSLVCQSRLLFSFFPSFYFFCPKKRKVFCFFPSFSASSAIKKVFVLFSGLPAKVAVESLAAKMTTASSQCMSRVVRGSYCLF